MEGLSHIGYRKLGDLLKVTVRDDQWDKIYEREVKVGDKKALFELRQDLEHIGISFPQKDKNKKNGLWFS